MPTLLLLVAPAVGASIVTDGTSSGVVGAGAATPGGMPCMAVGVDASAGESADIDGDGDGDREDSERAVPAVPVALVGRVWSPEP